MFGAVTESLIATLLRIDSLLRLEPELDDRPSLTWRRALTGYVASAVTTGQRRPNTIRLRPGIHRIAEIDTIEWIVPVWIALVALQFLHG